MYGPGPNVTAKTQPQSCRLPLPRRIPGKDFSYSDHEGVEAVIEMARLRPPPSNTTHNTAVEFRHQVSLREPARRLQVIGQAIDVMHRQEKQPFCALLEHLFVPPFGAPQSGRKCIVFGNIMGWVQF